MATFETLTPDSTVDVVGGTPTTGDGSPGVKLMINRPHHRFGIWLDKKNATALAYEVYRIAHLDTGLVDIDGERRAAVRERDEALAKLEAEKRAALKDREEADKLRLENERLKGLRDRWHAEATSLRAERDAMQDAPPADPQMHAVHPMLEAAHDLLHRAMQIMDRNA